MSHLSSQLMAHHVCYVFVHVRLACVRECVYARVCLLLRVGMLAGPISADCNCDEPPEFASNGPPRMCMCIYACVWCMRDAVSVYAGVFFIVRVRHAGRSRSA